MCEMNRRQRNVTVRGIDLPVIIDHGSLPDSARIEHSQSSHEVLNVDFEVQYYSRTDVGCDQFENIFNYASVVNAIRNLSGSKVVQPIESIADEILGWLISSASNQGLECIRARVRLVRPDFIGLTIEVESLWHQGSP